MSDITLSKAVRSNLLNLQSTAELLGKTQERLSTGLRVNSALDSPTAFFTASSLNSRANDLSQLLDSVSSAVQTIAAADKGITGLTKLVESAQATARQALQTTPTIGGTAAVTASVSTSNTTSVTITTSTPETLAEATTGDLSSLAATGGTITINGNNVVLAASDDEAAALTAIQNAATASSGANQFSVVDNGDDTFTITSASGNDLTFGGDSTTLTELGLTAGTTNYTAATGTAGDVVINGQTVTLANGDDSADILAAFQAAAGAATGTDGFSVTNTSGVLRFSGTDGNDIVISGDSQTLTALGLTAGTTNGTPSVAGTPNPKRAELVDQYNLLLTQIDELAQDASFNGVNLINGDNLSVLFNEDGTSKLDLVGSTFDSAGLGLTALATDAFDTNTSINATLDDLKAATDDLRIGASKFGSNLSIVQTRQDFTKNMINVLETGASNLTIADTNEEAANLLALQTRQQLSTTALSLASQADQNVLRLF